MGLCCTRHLSRRSTKRWRASGDNPVATHLDWYCIWIHIVFRSLLALVHRVTMLDRLCALIKPSLLAMRLSNNSRRAKYLSGVWAVVRTDRAHVGRRVCLGA